MHVVTKCFSMGWYGRRHRHAALCRHYKQHAHSKHRQATRQWLHGEDWDAPLESRPVTNWDVD